MLCLFCTTAGLTAGLGPYTSGVEEEWTITERLYREHKMRNFALFFKEVASGQKKYPGEH